MITYLSLNKFTKPLYSHNSHILSDQERFLEDIIYLTPLVQRFKTIRILHFKLIKLDSLCKSVKIKCYHSTIVLPGHIIM